MMADMDMRYYMIVKFESISRQLRGHVSILYVSWEHGEDRLRLS